MRGPDARQTLSGAGAATIDRTLRGLSNWRVTTDPVTGISEHYALIGELTNHAIGSVPLPFKNAFVQIMALDRTTAADLDTFSMIVGFYNPTASSSDRVSLVAGDPTYVQVIDNSNLSGLGDDGKLIVNMDEDVIYVRNRTGGPARIALRGWSMD